MEFALEVSSESSEGKEFNEIVGVEMRGENGFYKRDHERWNGSCWWGAAAAYSTNLALALIYKVLVVEMKRRIDQPDIQSNLWTLHSEIERLLKDVERLVKQDSESFIRFAQWQHSDNGAEKKRCFTDIVDVSMKLIEKSSSAIKWIDQLNCLVPQQMLPHLQLAWELLMGAINGTVHVVRDNLQAIKISKKKANYLTRLKELHDDCQKNYS